MVEKVPQGHGGALNSGGTPGNKGGGDYPDRIKRSLGKLAERGIKDIVKVLDDSKQPATLTELTRLVDVGAKYAVGTKIVLENEMASRLSQLAEMTAEYVPEDKFLAWHNRATQILMPQSQQAHPLDSPSTEGTTED